MSNVRSKLLPRFDLKRLHLYHPYLTALFPILALYSNNIREIEFSIIVRSIIITLLATTALLIVYRFLFRDFGKSALACTFSLVLFFSYGHIYTMLKEVSIFNALIGRHRILTPLWLGLFLFGMVYIARKQTKSDVVHRTLSLIMLITLISPMVLIVEFFVHTSFRSHQSEIFDNTQMNPANNPPASEYLPDIYYIILDGYTRQDTLLEFYGYDNQPFIQSLEEMGFFIASCSQSNYAQTLLSLPSSLNFGYLQDLMEKFEPGNKDRYELWFMLKHSATQRLLEGMGYSTVAFETGFYWSQLDDADFYLRRSTTELQKWQNLGGLNNFEVMLVKSTMGLIVADGFIALPKAFKPNFNSPDQKHRERVLFVMDELEQIPNYPSPKFVFAHIVSPHKPYVFDADGQFVTDITNNEGKNSERDTIHLYTNQITYINARMEKILEGIIASSERPPIIIVQADHGTNLGSRLNILNAYYLPGIDPELLYDTITPVNTFRLIFSQYLNMDLPLLEDRSFLSSYNDPFSVEEVINHCQP